MVLQHLQGWVVLSWVHVPTLAIQPSSPLTSTASVGSDHQGAAVLGSSSCPAEKFAKGRPSFEECRRVSGLFPIPARSAVC